MLALLATMAGGYANPDQLVETDWVAAHARDVRIIDMRRTGYEQGHVPGALYLAPEAIRDAANAPTFLPTPAAFASMMERLAISDATRVVVYDERGGIYAARLWWILNYFGHTNVALMNGGWTKWTAERLPSENGVPAMSGPAHFTPRPQPRWIATASDVVAAINQPTIKIVDARTAAEIAGTSLQGVKRGGFVPSSTPVYWEDLLDVTTRAFKSAEEIRQIYESRGILPANEVIAYCLVGMRASVDLFALHLVGYDNIRNYYGAWEEWGNRDDLPIATKKP